MNRRKNVLEISNGSYVMEDREGDKEMGSLGFTVSVLVSKIACCTIKKPGLGVTQ